MFKPGRRWRPPPFEPYGKCGCKCGCRKIGWRVQRWVGGYKTAVCLRCAREMDEAEVLA